MPNDTNADERNKVIDHYKDLGKLADDQGKPMLAEVYRRSIARLGKGEPLTEWQKQVTRNSN